MIALHLFRSSLVPINTQLLQAVLRAPAWANKLTDEDRRALSPLFWAHVTPYGRFRLAMDGRLDLGTAVTIAFTPNSLQRAKTPSLHYIQNHRNDFPVFTCTNTASAQRTHC
ncbi:Tn3 family transposase, partial [Streptosporangium roseum]|uniref:Tn3 family transposase n=1 Tax=Streptosporangium roseum TaxID=2001 RepID=UPI00331B9BAF